MNIIVVDSSSDEEIQFFPVPKGSLDDDDVIFCNVKRVPEIQAECIDTSKKLSGISLLKGKEVTIQSVRRKKKTASNDISDEDVQFLGILDTKKESSKSSLAGSPARRKRSESNVNININSQKSMNANLTINIKENTESTQKKVQLTFLGPSERGRNKTIPQPFNSNTNRFNPTSTSTPRLTYQNNSSRGNVNNRMSPNRINTINQYTVPARQRGHLNVAAGMNQSPKNNSQVPSNNLNYKKKGKENNSTTTPNTSPYVPFQNKKNEDSKSINKNFQNIRQKKPIVTYDKKNVQKLTESVQSTPEKCVQQHDAQASKPLVENSFEKKSKKKISNLTKKSPQGSPIKSSNPTDNEHSKSSNNEEYSDSKKKNINNDNDKKVKKRLSSPVPSTSYAVLPDISSSSESEEEPASRNSSTESSNSDEFESSKDIIKKSELDSLFNKFLNSCTQKSSKKEITDLKTKLEKHYSNTMDLAGNTDFVLTLKEVNVKMQNKTPRSHINIVNLMKKVLSQLRKNSPDNERKIKKLETVLKEVNKKIKDLEEAEVTSGEDESDNSYIKLDRYRKRAVQIYNKICELRSMPADAERPTHRNVSFLGSVPEAFSRSTSISNLVSKMSSALEKYYNKSRKFPDFNDVKILMTKLAVEASIKIKPETLHQLAKSIFIEFGSMLQRRRLHDDYRICTEYLGSDDDDPYYLDQSLAAKLDANRKIRKKEQEVLDKYCMKEVAAKEKFLSSEEDSSSHSSSENSDDDKKREHKSNNRSQSDDSDREDLKHNLTLNSWKKRRSREASSSSSIRETEEHITKSPKKIKTSDETTSPSDDDDDAPIDQMLTNYDNRMMRKRSLSLSDDSSDESTTKNKKLRKNDNVGNDEISNVAGQAEIEDKSDDYPDSDTINVSDQNKECLSNDENYAVNSSNNNELIIDITEEIQDLSETNDAVGEMPSNMCVDTNDNGIEVPIIDKTSVNSKDELTNGGASNIIISITNTSTEQAEDKNDNSSILSQDHSDINDHGFSVSDEKEESLANDDDCHENNYQNQHASTICISEEIPDSPKIYDDLQTNKDYNNTDCDIEEPLSIETSENDKRTELINDEAPDIVIETEDCRTFNEDPERNSKSNGSDNENDNSRSPERNSKSNDSDHENDNSRSPERNSKSNDSDNENDNSRSPERNCKSNDSDNENDNSRSPERNSKSNGSDNENDNSRSPERNSKSNENDNNSRSPENSKSNDSDNENDNIRSSERNSRSNGSDNENDNNSRSPERKSNDSDNENDNNSRSQERNCKSNDSDNKNDNSRSPERNSRSNGSNNENDNSRSPERKSNDSDNENDNNRSPERNSKSKENENNYNTPEVDIQLLDEAITKVQSDNEIAEINSIESINEEGSDEKKDTGTKSDLGNIQITSVTTCTEFFPLEDDCKRIPLKENSNKTATIVLSDDDEYDCVMVDEYKKTNVLTQEEIMELIPVILAKSSNKSEQ